MRFRNASVTRVCVHGPRTMSSRTATSGALVRICVLFELIGNPERCDFVEDEGFFAEAGKREVERDEVLWSGLNTDEQSVLSSTISVSPLSRREDTNTVWSSPVFPSSLTPIWWIKENVVLLIVTVTVSFPKSKGLDDANVSLNLRSDALNTYRESLVAIKLPTDTWVNDWFSRIVLRIGAPVTKHAFVSSMKEKASVANKKMDNIMPKSSKAADMCEARWEKITNHMTSWWEVASHEGVDSRSISNAISLVHFYPHKTTCWK